MTIIKSYLSNFSCGNAVPTQFLMWERCSHAFPPHYATANDLLSLLDEMLEELTCVPLSKRRENARLIPFYKIINNLAMVPHSCLEKVNGRTLKKHKLNFWHMYTKRGFLWTIVLS